MIASTVDIGNGVRLYYEEQGSGPALVCIPGMWGTCRFFRKQLDGLADRYRVIALDLRGHGRSTMTLEDQAIPAYARDLKAFVDRLGLEEFIGVGWSMGTFVWWDYYTQFGVAGLRGLVNIDQAPSDWRSTDIPGGLIDATTLKEWHFRLQTERNTFLRDLIPMMFAQPPATSEMNWMLDEMTRAPPVIAAAELVDQSLREYQEMLCGYPVPMLVCTGEKSPQPLDAMQMIVDRVRRGTLKVFKGCGHCLFMEDPDAFNREVDEFSRKHIARA